MISSMSQNSDNFTYAVDKTVKAFLLLGDFRNNSNVPMICVYIYVAILMVFACTMSWKCFQARQRRFQRIEKLLIVSVSQFHLSVGFWSCNALLIMSVTEARKEKFEYIGGEIYFDNTVLVLMHILLILFNIGIGLIMSIFSYDPFKRSNLSASTASIDQFLAFLFKCAISLLIGLNNHEGFAWLITLAGCLLSVLRHITIMHKFPYYNETVMRLNLIFSSISLLILGIAFLSQIFPTLKSNHLVIYLDILLFPFFAKYQISFLQKTVSKFLTLPLQELKTEDDVLKKIFAWESTITGQKICLTTQKDYERKDIEFWGFCCNSQTLKEECFQEDYSKRIRICLKDLLVECLAKFKDSSHLKLFLAEFIVNQQGTEDLIAGLNYLHQTTSRGILNRIAAVPLWKLYQDRISKEFQNAGEFDFKSFFEFEKSTKGFIELIHSNTADILKFWDAFKKPNLGTLFLTQQSVKVGERDEKIQNLYEEISVAFPKFLKELGLVYSTYLISVWSAESRAKKIQENSIISSSARERKQNLTSEALVLNISMEKEKFGEIVYSSVNISKSLGWNSKEVVGKNVNFLYPKFLKKINTQLLKDAFEKNPSKRKRFSEIYLLKKKGDLVPCFFETSIHPDIQQGIQCITVIQENAEQFEQIILSQSGTVVLGFTRKIGKFLLLKAQDKISFRDICRNSHHFEAFIQSKIKEEGQKILLHLTPNQRKSSKTFQFTVCVKLHQNHEDFFWILNFFSTDISDKQLKNSQNTEDQEILDSIPSEKENEPLTIRCTTEAILAPKCISDRSSLLLLEDIQQNTTIDPAAFLERDSERWKVENALYRISKEKRIRLLNILFLIFLLFTTGLLYGFQNRNTQVLNTLTANVDIAATSLTRLLRIINVYGLCLYQLSFSEGTMFIDRFAQWGLPNAKAATLVQFSLSVTDLLFYNTKLRNSIDRIEEGLTGSLDQKIPVYDLDLNGAVYTNRSLNSFDLVTEIVAKIQKIKFKKYNQIFGNNDTDIAFIIHNAVDSLLEISEQSIFVVKEDAQEKIENLLKRTFFLVALMGVFGLMLFGFFGYIVLLIIRDRRKCLDILRRIDEADVCDYLNGVQRFCSLLEGKDFSIQLVHEQIEELKGSFRLHQCQQQNPMRKKKPANHRGRDRQIIQVILFVFALVLFIFFGYFCMYAMVSNQNQKISNKVDLMVDSNYHFYEISLMKTSMLRYFNGFTNMTLRSRPYDKEWKKIYQDFSNINNELTKVTDMQNGLGKDPGVTELLVGDLCEQPLSSFAKVFGHPCDDVLNGVARKGILGIINAFLYLYQTSKPDFDGSSMTKNDSIRILNSPEQIQSEVLVPIYYMHSCDTINQRMRKQLLKDASEQTKIVQDVAIFFILVYLTVVPVLWWKVQKLLVEEKVKWRRIFRMVPITLAASSKMIKTYILAGTRETLCHDS